MFDLLVERNESQSPLLERFDVKAFLLLHLLLDVRSVGSVVLLDGYVRQKFVLVEFGLEKIFLCR